MLRSDVEAAAAGVCVGLKDGSKGGGLLGLATKNTPTSTHWALSPIWGRGWKWLGSQQSWEGAQKSRREGTSSDLRNERSGPQAQLLAFTVRGEAPRSTHSPCCLQRAQDKASTHSRSHPHRPHSPGAWKSTNSGL